MGLLIGSEVGIGKLCVLFLYDAKIISALLGFSYSIDFQKW